MGIVEQLFRGVASLSIQPSTCSRLVRGSTLEKTCEYSCNGGHSGVAGGGILNGTMLLGLCLSVATLLCKLAISHTVNILHAFERMEHVKRMGHCSAM